MSLWLNHTSYSTQETGRPLLTPGEVSILPSEEEIIFVAGHPPILAGKLFYYKDKHFIRRIVPAPDKSDVCRLAGPSGVPFLTGDGAGDGTAGISAAAAGLAVTLETMGSVRTNRSPESLPETDLLKEDKEETEKPERPEAQDEDQSEEEDDYLYNILMLAQIREDEREENDHDRGIAL